MAQIILKFQQQVKELVEKFNFEWSPYVQYIHLVEEVGELGEALTVRLHDRQSGSGTSAQADHADIEEELGDVLFNVLEVANQQDINMDKVFEETLRRYEEKLANSQKITTVR